MLFPVIAAARGCFGTSAAIDFLLVGPLLQFSTLSIRTDRSSAVAAFSLVGVSPTLTCLSFHISLAASYIAHASQCIDVPCLSPLTCIPSALAMPRSDRSPSTEEVKEAREDDILTSVDKMVDDTNRTPEQNKELVVKTCRSLNSTQPEPLSRPSLECSLLSASCCVCGWCVFRQTVGSGDQPRHAHRGDEDVCSEESQHSCSQPSACSHSHCTGPSASHTALLCWDGV